MTLTDTELTDWLQRLRQDAQAASRAAAVATGDESTRNMLATAADVAQRRAEWLRSRALPATACTWCDAVGELCALCKARKEVVHAG